MCTVIFCVAGHRWCGVTQAVALVAGQVCDETPCGLSGLVGHFHFSILIWDFEPFSASLYGGHQ